MPSSKFSNEIIEALSIDCLIFGFRDGQLDILLIKHAEGISKGKWALPGGWIQYNESVDEAANRLLKSLTGVENIYLEQLRSFGNIERYPEKRVITIAYYALVNADHFELNPGFTASEAKWFNIKEVPKLPYDHSEILAFGFNHLKHKVRHEPIGFNLLPKKFSLHQIQKLYEAILEKEMDKPNFRRKLLNMNLLVLCDEKQKDVSHRAANLYRFDRKIYNQLTEKGFSFEL
jgi:ADP-ribose pyrophosphatase YjhB (NUDIX family)